MLKTMKARQKENMEEMVIWSKGLNISAHNHKVCNYGNRFFLKLCPSRNFKYLKKYLYSAVTRIYKISTKWKRGLQRQMNASTKNTSKLPKQYSSSKLNQWFPSSHLYCFAGLHLQCFQQAFLCSSCRGQDPRKTLSK